MQALKILLYNREIRNIGNITRLTFHIYSNIQALKMLDASAKVLYDDDDGDGVKRMMSTIQFY